MFILSLLAIEWVLKIFFAFKVGPSILLPGRVDVHKEIHTVKYHNHKKRVRVNKVSDNYDKRFLRYAKYFPHQKVIEYDINTKETFRVTINSKGLRGRNYENKKKPNTIRIIALGASSTFGYFNRDNETYPYYMEQILNSMSNGIKSFEVLNFGIPHLRAGSILALFLKEGIPLNPDIVTFCEGVNDTIGKVGQRQKKKTVRIIYKYSNRSFKWMRKHFLFAKMIYLTVSSLKKFSKQDINQYIEGRSMRFLENLSIIHEECQKNGIKFIVANQQARSIMIMGGYPQDEYLADRAKYIKGITYQMEVDAIKKRLSENGFISQEQLSLLTHSILMKDLKVWTSNNNIPFVDIIDALDHDRDLLSTWVHLSPEGNRIVAEKFAEKILEEMLP
jgi:lysophospholipase L1-like esterase